ncbi:hypothetical protein HK101_008945 [Irineochytrium annulatum]|nr:hypothetical protein HK101_008945 [Irineochytrium annulatum]
MFEKRFLADGMERVGREKERLEEEVQKMGYRLDKEKVKLEAERKTVKEQRQDIADLKEELVQAGNRLMDEEEEFRQAQKQCMELKANVEAGEAEKRELQADLRQVKKEKADVIKFLQWYQDKCDQDILDLKHFFVLPLGFENAIKRELKSRNPASFGYDGEGKMSIKGFQELCAGVLKLAAFRAEINTKYAVDVELDVEGLHFQYSSRRDALKRVHLLVTFCEKRTGDCVGRTAIELAVISAGACPHNKHPFKMPPKLIQEPASYLESLRSTQTQAYRDMFSDQSHTVHLVTGKGKKRYMTVESLIKGKKAAATNFWLEGEASVITQRVVVVQVVSSCIVEDVRD